MATKEGIIAFILDKTDKFGQYDELKKMRKSELELISNEIKTEEITTHENDLPFYVESDEMETELDMAYIEDDDIILDELEDGDVIVEEIEEEWDYDKLSPADQKLYRRTGIKKITKTIKYTRFDSEEPKI